MMSISYQFSNNYCKNEKAFCYKNFQIIIAKSEKAFCYKNFELNKYSK
jgi:hypothetical protein